MKHKRMVVTEDVGKKTQIDVKTVWRKRVRERNEAFKLVGKPVRPINGLQGSWLF